MAPIDIAITRAKAGDTAGLEDWIAGGGNPNAHDADGWTPLLWASARGHAATVAALLARGAESTLAHGRSAALPIHMAGHSGDVATATALLDHAPDQIDAVWDLNGHTILLQAVFYGHLDLARTLVERGADTAITTARGLGPMEFAHQFQNQPMTDVLRPYDSPAEKKAAYYARYLERIAPIIPEAEKPAQALADRLCRAIEDGIHATATDPTRVDATLAAVRALVEDEGADVNRLGGPLHQPPLIVAVTGNNGLPANPTVKRLRDETARYLLERGADPARHEDHPMGAQTIIRAAVFNHLDILRMCGAHMTPVALADAINEVPIVNGLTAMHDTCLRAGMVAAEQAGGYIEQARWFTENGGRHDMEDFSGQTQQSVAESCPDPERRRRLLAALGVSS
ncbi:ankyrin repeat domain-containing protein [Roseospira marina]|uniref:Ankyrin repeat domain-containing protein n=1 Tax=Roseospira marina TaxID=140057 RepID=A0A5M6I8R3_9PROT|nr:ankyrin repeat domain-containing protein [Roseospira marina]KAA5604088.1 ankyrin repeat domain-containing protein [Roseospira marina]MBB4315813.1 ankyrin repeat protein [Roseospira marina]MBB5088948.1 ankyrin repeat protein [Roseospira marina]